MGVKSRLGQLVPAPHQAVLAALVAAAALFLNDRYLFESVVIPSSSMRPTIVPNERVFLKKLGNEYRRFDVVVIDSPVVGHRIVKRVIGLPGERVRLEDSWRVFINGKSLDYTEPDGEQVIVEAGTHYIQLVRNPKFFYPTVYGKADLLLGPNEYYVLGDNRLASDDGRDFGPVTRDQIQGALTRVWYSYDKAAHAFRWERLGRVLR